MAARKKATAAKARTAVKAAKKGAKKAPTTSAAKKASTSAKATFTLPNKPISQKQTKAQIYTEIAELAQVSKTEAKSMFAAIRNLIERHVHAKGSGEIVLPELGIKVRRIHKKATKAKMGRNPFTGEEIQIPAKPARKSVKVSAMKALKALAES